MTGAEKTWHDCPCGESLAVSDSIFGQAVLQQWTECHKEHATAYAQADQEATP